MEKKLVLEEKKQNLIQFVAVRPLTVQILNKNRHLSADRSYEVECRTIGSRPEAQITWWKEKKPMRGKARNVSVKK